MLAEYFISRIASNLEPIALKPDYMGLRQEGGEMEDGVDYVVRLSQKPESDWSEGSLGESACCTRLTTQVYIL